MKRPNLERYRDRRSDRRYRVRADIEFHLGSGRTARIGRGRTVNLSRTGVLFESDDALPLDSEITLLIPWPVHISDQSGLKLSVRGRTVRVQGNRTAVRFRSYTLQTAGVSKGGKADGNGKV
jgi:PilZ domain-containing protein